MEKRVVCRLNDFSLCQKYGEGRISDTKPGQANSRGTSYQFWRQDNRPQDLYNSSFIFQRMNYIHNNPVEAGIVEKPEHYMYSSAKDYYFTKNVVYWIWFLSDVVSGSLNRCFVANEA
ncbi:MAG: hypothetical protein KA821_20975 [Chitinophagaceae bacterium]|nr:hypothetical protein [Chitinophagaceae bacterium]